MTEFEKNLRNALDNDKIIYYDYISYKKAIGWSHGLNENDWCRPDIIKKAKYCGDFLCKLPKYYFIGMPIKELLKHDYANGCCHACALALSIYFKDFEIITCNLKTYAKHYQAVTREKHPCFRHSFLTINMNDKTIVIDSTFGFITDLSTYNKIFAMTNIKRITSDELNKTTIYNYIKYFKNYKAPISQKEYEYNEKKGHWYKNPQYIKYYKIKEKFFELCYSYKNQKDSHLEGFINSCLPRTTKINNWYLNLKFENNDKIKYPNKNLYSIIDDEYDETLHGIYDQTIKRNEEVLSSYHTKVQKK